MRHGRCQCGTIRLAMPDEPLFATLCHCGDCRRGSGAPVSAWAMVARADVTVDGVPTVYASSESGRRSFCGRCGTGLFFANAKLDGMGLIQVRIAALDNPEAVTPRLQVQCAERLGWMAQAHTLPAVPRFPG